MIKNDNVFKHEKFSYLGDEFLPSFHDDRRSSIRNKINKSLYIFE